MCDSYVASYECPEIDTPHHLLLHCTGGDHACYSTMGIKWRCKIEEELVERGPSRLLIP